MGFSQKMCLPASAASSVKRACVRGRAEQHGIDIPVVQHVPVVARRARDMMLGGQRLCRRQVHVRHGEHACGGHDRPAYRRVPLPMRPAPNDADVEDIHSWLRALPAIALDPMLAQVRTVACRASPSARPCRAAHPAPRCPSGCRAAASRSARPGSPRHPAQLAEHAAAHRLKVTQPLRGWRGNLRLAVLEVDVPDAVGKAAQPLGHARNRRSKGVVARVERTRPSTAGSVRLSSRAISSGVST